MKKTILFLVFIFLYSLNTNAQLVVSDPNMLAASAKSWGDQLTQAQETFKQMQEQTQILKDASEALKKVNSSISTMKSVQSLVKQQSVLINFFTSEINKAKNESVSYEATTAYVKRLDRLQQQVLTNTTYLTQLLSEGIFNLTDGERLRELRELENQNGRIISAANREKSRFDTTNAQLREVNRLMQK